MRVGGTNRDGEVTRCLEDQGVIVEVLHLNDVLRRRNLSTYQGLVLPGGFAYGDYVRAGAIWAKKLCAFMKDDFRRFVEGRKPILGICNGFQVLVEAGLLPGFDFLSEEPELALASNQSSKFECRWVSLRKNAKTNCIFTKDLPDIVRFPVAHSEGRILAGSSDILKKIDEGNQIVLQYALRRGEIANGEYPSNPNGSTMDIAAMCDSSGTIMGMMPHPEDAYWGYQLPNWTYERKMQPHGDGFGVFKSMVDYIEGSL
jgi:phosphoribosylformylglycinamidine synthase subunit PurQ / glutaminase